ILGDVAHNPLQVHETGWKVDADVDHDQARMTRESIMKRIEDEGLKMAAGHFPAPGFGKVIRLEGKRYWKAL
ncbi:MAG: MBL fold metallo-hydrolase, partial [Chloroflexi bacterium]|nr:MBL fold metallo-hydrolase [Chloroflexota bacterium]